MRLSLAPMEGLTNPSFRRAHERFFGGADVYYTPFYVPTSEGYARKFLDKLAAERCTKTPTVVQFLTVRATDFLAGATQVAALGYEEINLNFGCPSGTVTAKGKGAGALRTPEAIDRLLDGIFAGLDHAARGMRVSVKTRIGYDSTALLPEILDVYNRYPISELIVHPRLRSDFYRGHTNFDAFAYVYENSRAPVAYNGDIFTKGDYATVTARFPRVDHVMIGRGALADPALFLALRGTALSKEEKKKRLAEMHAAVLEENKALIGEGRGLACRMADWWHYLIFSFSDDAADARPICSARNLAEYRAEVSRLFRERDLREGGFVAKI